MIAQCEATNSCPRASEGIRGGGIAGGGAAISGVRAWLCWAAGICNLNEDANSNAPKAETPQICDSDSPTGRTPDPDDDNDPQKKGRPGDNKRQNKQVNDAANKAGLSPEQRRALGREVEYESRHNGRNLGYKEIEQIARDIKQGRL